MLSISLDRYAYNLEMIHLFVDSVYDLHLDVVYVLLLEESNLYNDVPLQH